MATTQRNLLTGALTAAGTVTTSDLTRASGLQNLPAQRLYNLNASWNAILGKPLDLILFITNLTQEKFYTFSTGASFGFDSAILNEPRMYGARLKYRFGGVHLDNLPYRLRQRSTAKETVDLVQIASHAVEEVSLIDGYSGVRAAVPDATRI